MDKTVSKFLRLKTLKADSFCSTRQKSYKYKFYLFAHSEVN